MQARHHEFHQTFGLESRHAIQAGATAVDRVASLLTLRQFATSDRSTILVPGVWRAGKTLV
ncbi:MAG: hypothetical protein H7067_05295 [Burkholderiales bacterium]|nr:hypothetical protein [Opitutaceae bacterium]